MSQQFPIWCSDTVQLGKSITVRYCCPVGVVWANPLCQLAKHCGGVTVGERSTQMELTTARHGSNNYTYREAELPEQGYRVLTENMKTYFRVC